MTSGWAESQVINLRTHGPRCVVFMLRRRNPAETLPLQLEGTPAHVRYYFDYHLSSRFDEQMVILAIRKVVYLPTIIP